MRAKFILNTIRSYTRGAEKINIVEVGPRDGLQNESHHCSIEERFELIQRLAKSGLKIIEAGSFVSPKWVPQMKDSGALYERLQSSAMAHRGTSLRFPMLVPNHQGYEDAQRYHVKDIAVFASASESFSKKNTNCTIQESIDRFTPIVQHAKKSGLWVRGYISCIIGCPYEGPIQSTAVSALVASLLNMGCDEISLGDTIGVATAGQIRSLVRELKPFFPVSQLALHCHDTYGQALANIWASIDEGIRTFDASIAGLGGCPYARGASGNVATEDLVYMCQGSGFETNVSLEALGSASDYILSVLGKSTSSSRVGMVRQRRQGHQNDSVCKAKV